MSGLRIIAAVLFVLIAEVPSAAAQSPAAEPFKVLFAGQQTIDQQNCIAVTFSAPVDGTLDLNRFMALVSEDQGQVDGAWVLTSKGQVAYFSNVEADTTYEVQVRKGLRAADGRVLKAPYTGKVKTRPAKAFVSFASSGFVLPSDLSRGLPVSTLNVTAADIDFFRVRQKHVVDFIALFGQNNALSYYQMEELQRFTELVYSARFDLPAAKNVLTQAVLPIGDIDALAAPGIYLAVLRQAGNYPYENQTIWFTISDIGLHARVYPRIMNVQVQHLSSGEVFEGVELQVLDNQGRVLEQDRSDSDGRTEFVNHADKAQLLIARHGAQTSVVPLTGPALDLSAFDLGRQPFRPLELFVYGPRNLYRPGETVHLQGLLRDQDGRLTATRTPIAVSIKQPDGQAVKEFTWHPEALNAYAAAFDLPAAAQTGLWTAEFTLADQLVQTYPFRVEDFMPERMKLTLDNGDESPTRIGPDGDIALQVEGSYLYGAPAAGNRVGCHVSMALLPEAVESLPGFRFGHPDETIQAEFDTPEIQLDEEGKGVIAAANQWRAVRSPMAIRLHTSLYESGGRPVSRDKLYHLWPAGQLVGIRPLWQGEEPAADSLVQFEIVKTDAGGGLLAASDLSVVLIREYPDYYWEFNAASGWERVVNSQHYTVARTKMDIKAGERGTVSFPVEWGPYRIEVSDPATGLVSAHRFSAGWSWHGDAAGRQGNRPDQVLMTLDKPAYRAGETARVLIKPPQSGTALVVVEGDRMLWRTVMAVASEGTLVDIPVDPSWDRHDLHIGAMVIRPADQRRNIAPRRALGIIHLPLDRKPRRLGVSIGVASKVRPNTTVDVDLAVDNFSGSSADANEVYVTLAAVDVGVLSLTRFETPDPASYFFGRRRYGVDCRDLYQKIIEGLDAPAARKRYGGDGLLALSRGGDKPMTDVRIVSLFHGPVRIDGQGRARVTLDLPDFNGRLRMMAVAYGAASFGAAQQEITVAAPVTAEIAMPRFLALGDQAWLALDLRNLSGLEQAMTVELTASSPILLHEGGPRQVRLADKARTTLRYAVTADDQVGVAELALVVNGIRAASGEPAVSMRRSWRLATRPAYPAVTRQWRRFLKPGESLGMEAAELEGLLPRTVRASIVLSAQPPIDVAGHVRELHAYPYGCLEQTTSGIYPQVLLSADLVKQLGIEADTPEARRRKVEQGIDRLVGLQKPEGGFGLWSGTSPEEYWLTAYVSDFLISARDQGYSVPQTVLAKAVERLQAYLARPAMIQARYTDDEAHARLAAQAYSAFVLARIGKAPLGTLRALADNHAAESRSGLPLVHLGLALHLQGDGRRSRTVLDQAARTVYPAERWLGDYGSPLRDAALSYYLLSAYGPDTGRAREWLLKLADALREQPWLSTQERNALVLAGLELIKDRGKDLAASLHRGPAREDVHGVHTLQATYGYDDIKEGLRIQATEASGARGLYAAIVLNGYSRGAPPASRETLDIARTYYDLQGKAIQPAALRSGDLVMVRLDVSSRRRIADGLVVDLLPAGLELENPHLTGGMNLDPIRVEGRTIGEWKADLRLLHEEFRDDRYVAAIDLSPHAPATLFYLARAVSPGVFKVPNAFAEDMYRPELRAVGEAFGDLEIRQP